MEPNYLNKQVLTKIWGTYHQFIFQLNDAKMASSVVIGKEGKRVWLMCEVRGSTEAHGRDLASTLPPTLLAAESQTVCSQQYMHLLALFQEIITQSLCVALYVCL